MEKDEFPPLSDALTEINRSTIDVCRKQLSAFFGRPMRGLPSEYGSHDLLVASYICGFVHGNNISTSSLKEWAESENAVEEIGWLIMSTACIGAILDGERMLAVQEKLPQLSFAEHTKSTAQLDHAGGSDGMDFAEGKFNLKNGLLLRYLNYNLKPSSEVRHTTEQEDLAAIEANPISRWIFKNPKIILYVLGIIIGIALFA